MSALRWVAIGVAVVAVVLGGCALDAGVATSSSGGFAGGGGGTYSGTAAAAPSGASGPPMLVVVDTNRTMTARPGEGVGVFTEYASGGHWHVWWTCDTLANSTHAGCNYDIRVSLPSGAFANVAGQELEQGDTLVQSSESEFDVVTLTSAGIDGVTFDAPAGNIVTIDAKLGGTENGSLLFFVQDDVVNGNYQGALTDPLMLEPTVP